MFKVARLQSELCTKDLFELRILRKMLRTYAPKLLSPYFLVGPKKSRKIPAKIPVKFPCEINKKFTDELLQESRENIYTPKSRFRKHRGVQKSMGHKVPWKTGMLLCHPVTLQPLNFFCSKKQFYLPVTLRPPI